MIGVERTIEQCRCMGFVKCTGNPIGGIGPGNFSRQQSVYSESFCSCEKYDPHRTNEALGVVAENWPSLFSPVIGLRSSGIHVGSGTRRISAGTALCVSQSGQRSIGPKQAIDGVATIAGQGFIAAVAAQCNRHRLSRLSRKF